MKKIIFASGNKGKVTEVRRILGDSKLEIISLHDLEDVPEIIEDGETYEANARIKAEIIFRKFGLPVLADDSGLSVELLQGRPGVHSARYAFEGCSYEDNNNKLLSELSVFEPPYKAKFVTCAVYMDKDNYCYSIGELPGKIITELRGTNGFGYDPVFIPEGFDSTLAEMTSAEKNNISHRSKAFMDLKKKIVNFL
ncbi:MAG: RdgB/HAM1 family non-canonical purine NTP pyrophosphatase [Methanococcaceae archaeon]